MPAIPIFREAPINDTEASAPNEQTEASHSQKNSEKTSELPQNQVGATTPSSTRQPYPSAQPGAAPSLPVQTASAQAYPAPQPTPTKRDGDVSPPLPQPGAVPVPVVGHQAVLPSAPKTGQTYRPPNPTPATQATVPYPPQMAIPPPTKSHLAQRETSTSTSHGPHVTGPRPIPLGGDSASNLEHPPGYRQDVSASEFNSHQRAAHNAAVASAAERGSQAQSDEGVWDTAKKWAQAAGGTLAAAEQEVWRRINKD